jgi:Lipocalin-like domain
VRKTIPVAIVLLLALMLGQTVQTAKPSNPEADAQRFLGAWRVVSVTDTRPDGTAVPDLYLGPHPVGFIIYEAAGYMCFGGMNPERAKWADESNGTSAEMAAAAEGYDSYCGAYEINEGRKTVTHHVRIALVPNDVGTDLERKYEFSGNQLKLSGTNALQPGFKFWTVTFERATQAR